LTEAFVFILGILLSIVRVHAGPLSQALRKGVRKFERGSADPASLRSIVDDVLAVQHS
jgi:hypothetical protein